MKIRIKNLLVGIAVIAALAITVLMITLPQSAQNKSKNKEDEPTTIQLGVMSEKQKKHSKLYNQPEEARSKLLSSNKDIKIVIGSPYKIDTSNSSISQEYYFQRVTCQSDTVLVAKVISKASQLSEDKKSVFTDYELQVKNIVKNNPELKLQTDDLVILTRSGGKVKLNNRVIEVIDESYKPLHINGEYLFFLNYLVDSDSFRASDAEGTLEIANGKLNRFSDSAGRYPAMEDDLNTFVSSISVLDQRCKKGGK
jgi:hypothetical protein